MSIIEDYKVLVKNGTEKILSNGGEWNKWLKFAGNTYTYDVNNSIAIYMQNPKVTAAAELTEWNDYNRRVHKGQKGIMIYKITDNINHYDYNKEIFTIKAHKAEKTQPKKSEPKHEDKSA